MPEHAVTDWERVKAILDVAMEQAPAARGAYLDTACAGEPPLRAEVEALLAVHDRMSDADTLSTPFAAGPASADDAHESAWIGRTVGSYRITGIVGRGGMGVVYLAEHTDVCLAQRVAVKLLRRGFRPDDLRRFREEQRILARLEHPNIARLLDAGVSEDGVPYLIMEYVDGRPLLEHCRAEGLGLRARLELFETVCAAVQAAHSSLVVHRDLKPSNILVDREGRPKLLDFGIAKLLDEDAAAQPLTRTGQHVLTPEYASPEQFRGEPSTTLSDIYSLGVVLYELLCDRRPHRLEGLSAAEAERIVSQEEPRRPSRTDTAESRRLAGDLDVVVLTALSKAPVRRYASAAQLADDLRRHRAGLPIHARPDTLHYRVTKFVGRNRGPLAALALLILALIGGIVATTRQAMETRRRFEEVRALANTLLFDIQAEIRDLPGTTPLRRRIVDRATRHLDGLARDAARDPGLRMELAAAYEQLAELQGDPHFASLGDLAGADTTYRKALVLREALAAAAPADPARRRALANLVGRLGVLRSWLGDNAAAVTLSRRALEELGRLSASAPEDAALRAEAARVRGELGWWRIWSGEVDFGLTDVRAAAATLDSLLLHRPDDVELGLERSTLSLYLADGYKFKGDYVTLVAELESGVARLDSLSRLNPGHLRIRRKQLGALRQLGEGYEWVDPRRALESYRQGLDVARELYRVDGSNAASGRALGLAASHLGGMLLDLGQFAAAVTALEEARDHQQRLRDQDPGNVADGGNLATTRIWLAQSLGRLGVFDRAIAEARGAVALHDSMGATAAEDGAALANMATAHGVVGFIHQSRARAGVRGERPAVADWRAAAAAYRAALAIFARLRAEGRFMEYWQANQNRVERGLASADSALGAHGESSAELPAP